MRFKTINIKVQVNEEQFEIDVFSDGDTTYHFAEEYLEDTSTWGYEIFEIGEDGERISFVGDERAGEDAPDAASYAMSHLIGILTNDDHSIED